MASDCLRTKQRVVCFGNAFVDRLDALAAQLGDSFEVVHVSSEVPPERMAKAFAGALAVVTVAAGQNLPLADDLKLLQVPGIGWDGIDPAQVPATASIANVGGHEGAVAEYCLAQMLDWCHRLREADAEFRRGSWARSSRFGGAPHRELRGSTIGIVGYGGIGRELACKLKAFGVNVAAANRSASSFDDLVDARFGLNEIPRMLEQCDFAVIAIALTPQTKGLISKAELSALGREGVLINVARGPIVDEDALFHALSAGVLGGAVIDVWYRYPERLDDDDPKPSRYEFASLPNVVMTPHISGWTEGTAARRVMAIADNIDRAAKGKPLHNVVARGTRHH